jgi:hypothetical protein
VQRIPGIALFAGEVARVSAIVDTNVILGLIHWHARKQKDPEARPATLELLDGGLLTLYAPSHLWNEVAEKLPEKAVEWGTSAEELRQRWEIYSPRVRCLELRGQFDPPPNAGRDPDDHAYLHLQQQHPDLPILTRDNDIAGMDGQALRPEVLLDLRDYARHRAVEVTLVVGGVLCMNLGCLAFKAIGEVLAKIWRAIPEPIKWTLFGLAIAGGIYLLFNPDARRACAEALKNALGKLGRASLFLLQETVPLYQLHRDERDDAVRHLAQFRAALPPVAGRRTLRGVVRDVLARSDRSLTLEEIAQRVLLFGYRPRGSEVSHRRYLRRVLTAHPDVAAHGDRTWSLAFTG